MKTRPSHEPPRNGEHTSRAASPSARAAAAWPFGAALVAFALYVALAPGVVGDGDAGEFTLVLAVGGVPHPPGYPLYALLGHSWVTLLHGLGVGWAGAASAWSALGGAVAVGLLVALGMRLASAGSRLDIWGRAAPALVAAGLLALNPVWLREVMVAEVNSWHVALVVALCLTAFEMLRTLEARKPPAILRGVLLWGLLCGVAISHRLTAAFFVVPLSVMLFAFLPRGERSSPGVWFGFLGGLAAPFVAYAFVAWRAAYPAPYQWPLLVPGWDGLLAHMRAEVFTFYLGAFAPIPEQQTMLNTVVYPVLVPGFLLLIWTLFRAPERTVRTFAGGLFAAAAIQLAFALQYGVPDPLTYFVPVLMVGTLAITERLSRIADRIPGPAILAPAIAALAMLALIWLPQAVARRDQLAAVDHAIRARWDSIPFERGIVLWTGDYYVRLRAYQLLEGDKAGLYVESPAMLTWEPPRRTFQRTIGFDPLAGLTLESDADLPRIQPNIARQTPLPVIDFERWEP